MLARAIETRIDEYLTGDNNKIFFILGPRRSGKTTILQKLSAKLGVPIFNFDVLSDKEKFLPKRDFLQQLIKDIKIILIDEVQNYPESTVALKILHDEFNIKIIATGNSELRQKSRDFDSLVGRFIESYCLPLSVFEIANNVTVKDYEKKDFENKLQQNFQIFGAYPEVYSNKQLSESEKIDLLQNILDTYVLKDIINIYELKNEKL